MEGERINSRTGIQNNIRGGTQGGGSLQTREGRNVNIALARVDIKGEARARTVKRARQVIISERIPTKKAKNRTHTPTLFRFDGQRKTQEGVRGSVR